MGMLFLPSCPHTCAHSIDAAMDLISSLNALDAEGASVLSSAQTREREECSTMHAEKNLQEMLEAHDGLLRSIESDIRALSTTGTAPQPPTPQRNRVLSSRYTASPSLSSPAPSPQLLRTRSTPSRVTGSPFSHGSGPMSASAFGE